MKKHLLAFVILALSSVIGSVYAQQRPIYDQYHFNYYLINPAVAGADRCSHIMATTKNSFVGLNGAGTYLLSFRTRLNSKNIGLGGYIYSDNTPNFNYIGGEFTFAYHIPLSNGGRYSRKVMLDRQLSFGLSAKIKYVNYSAHNTDPGDPADVDESEVAPDINFGAYYTSYGFFGGVSMTNIIPFKNKIFGNMQNEVFTAFLFAGYEFNLGAEKFIEPSLNFNVDANGNKQLEANLKFTQNSEARNASFWGQLSYRHNFDSGSGQPLSLIPIVGARFGKFQLAYAFNLLLSNIQKDCGGNHEIMLAYTFCIPKRFCR